MLDPIFNSPQLATWLQYPLLQLVFIVITTIFAAAKVTIQGAACRKHIRTPQDSLMYNTIFFLFVSLSLALTLSLRIPNTEILLWAATLAFFNVLFQVFYSVALTVGPISITVLIINFCIVVPTTVSFIVFRENIYISQLLGVILLLISFPLSIKETGESGKGVNKKWLFFTIITLISNCVASTMTKLFKLTASYAETPDTSTNTLLFFLYLFGAFIAYTIYKIKSMVGTREKRTFKLGKSVILFALAMGLDLAIFQKCNMTAVLNIPGSIYFPTQTGIQSVLMTVIGIILFGDRLTKTQWLGTVFGILAVVFLNVQIGFSFVIG